MRWTRVATTAAALALALSSGAPVLGAEEGGAAAPVSKEEFEKQRRKALDAAIAKLASAAAIANQNKLRRTALSVHELILEIDDDNQKSREALGWVRKGPEWVLDEMKQDRLHEVEDENEKARPEYEKRWKAACTAAATILTDVGHVAVRAEEPKAARGLWRLARRLDRQHPAANTALGNVFLRGEWLPRPHVRQREFQREIKATRGRILTELGSVVMPKESSGVLEARGAVCRRVQFADFRLESDFEYDVLVEAATRIAAERALYRELLEGHNASPDAAPYVVVVIRREAPRGSPLELRFSPRPPPEVTCLQDGTLVVTAESLDAAAPLVLHDMAHRAVHRALGETADWIREGLANALSNLERAREVRFCARLFAADHLLAPDQLPIHYAIRLVSTEAEMLGGNQIGELVLAPAGRWRARMLAAAWSSALFLLVTDPRAGAAYFRDCAGSRDRGADPKVLAKAFPAWPDWTAFARAHDEWALDLLEFVE